MKTCATVDTLIKLFREERFIQHFWNESSGKRTLHFLVSWEHNKLNLFVLLMLLGKSEKKVSVLGMTV